MIHKVMVGMDHVAVVLLEEDKMTFYNEMARIMIWSLNSLIV